jgi:ubiquinone/menaquinone biosynthesis C-methylase UbiE
LSPRKFEATELNSADTALAKLETWTAHVPKHVQRLRPWMRLEPGDPVLDVGAAQGVTVTAFMRHGYAARGVEPSSEALATRPELIERTGVETDIVEGVAERLPFGDSEFQYVHVYSVMEHVDDPWTVFREVHRVLRPGGGMYFNTTSRLSPFQHEIGRFPLFPWYPDRVRRKVMTWAMRERPWLVGHSTRPAFLWYSHREVQRRLREAGFTRIVNRWELRSVSGELSGARHAVVTLAARNRVARFFADIALGGMEYVAVRER